MKQITILRVVDYGATPKKVTLKRYRSTDKAIDVCNSLPKSRYYAQVIVNGETVHET